MMSKNKILLLYPPWRGIYEKAKVKAAVKEGYPPPLTLSTLAAPLLNSGFDVEILDMDIFNNPIEILTKKLQNFSPDVVGITCLTPSFNRVAEIAQIIKSIDKKIIIIGGGPHISSLPIDSLKNSLLDIAVIGEGDYTIVDVMSGDDLDKIEGICFKKGDEIICNTNRKPIQNLDSLPYPAWNLFNLKNYKVSKLICKKSPVGSIETSRGCVFGCVYCNKSVFGRTFRFKSPERTVNEIEYMLNNGFKEIHVMDDGFTTNINRAKKICDLIKQRDLDFYWNLSNGIRVDRVDREFLEKAYDTGCYRITIGVESGDQNLLHRIGKGVTIEKTEEVFKMTRDIGIETLAYFMIALPGETEDSMRKTIDFAKKLEPTVAKVSVTLPLPGTPLFDEWDKLGYIKSKNWSLYNQHDPSKVYNHPDLEWETIMDYYNNFYREFYLRGSYILRRLKKDIFNFNYLISDMRYFISTKW